MIKENIVSDHQPFLPVSSFVRSIVKTKGQEENTKQNYNIERKATFTKQSLISNIIMNRACALCT